MFDLEEKLDDLVETHRATEVRLSDPALLNDQVEYQRVVKRHNHLSAIVNKYKEWQEATQTCADAEELMKDGDAEMAEMAREEFEEASARLEPLEQEIRLLLLPKDENDEKNTLIEIRAGTGGEEAALFSADLLKMYTRYGEARGWKIELISANLTGLGGYKEVIFMARGDNVFSRLKYEAGIHRVQRVPETEAAGRIHTSAVTVAVMPEAEEVDIAINMEDLRIDTYHSSGPGGQSVNTTDSAVRITHEPTGLVVTCQDEKSQLKNRAKAMGVLRSRLYEQERQKQDDEASATRRSMVGSGDRSQKIRTYNFPENRLTDHRIGLRLYSLDRILDGALDPVIDPMVVHVQTEQLKQASEEAAV